MIKATSKVDSLCRNAFGKDKVQFSKMDLIIPQLAVDPALSKPETDAYIVHEDDFKRVKVKTAFMEALEHKHPDTKVIIIYKSTRNALQPGDGIYVMVKPKPPELADLVFSIIQQLTDKAAVLSSAEQAEVRTIPPMPSVPELNITNQGTKEMIQNIAQNLAEGGEWSNQSATQRMIAATTESSIESEKVVVPVDTPVEGEESNPITDLKLPESDYVRRVKDCGTVSDANLVSKELSTAAMLKELAQQSATYKNIEDKVKAINDKINSIMIEPVTPLEDKLHRVEAFLIDKDVLMTRSNTIVEQRIEEIIKTITSKTCELLSDRLKQIDAAIEYMSCANIPSNDFGRVSGFFEQRSAILMELVTLDGEIANIFKNIDNMSHECVQQLASTGTALTENPLLNAHLRIRGKHITPTDSMDAIRKILVTCNNSTEEFHRAIEMLDVVKSRLYRVIELDNDIIQAQEEIIKYLKSNNIEDTVIAHTMIKKSMRVFVGEERSGKSVIPLIISGAKSREVGNVLLVDLTGTCKYKNYGVETYPLDNYLDNLHKKPFCIVSGVIPTDDQISRFVTAMVKSADFYKVINIVVSPDQQALLNVLLPDVFSVNYIISGDTSNIDKYARFIKETRYNNVAQRVILNRCPAFIVRNVIERLDIKNELKINVINAPYVEQIIDCSYNHVKPYDVNYILEQFREVTNHA